MDLHGEGVEEIELSEQVAEGRGEAEGAEGGNDSCHIGFVKCRFDVT